MGSLYSGNRRCQPHRSQATSFVGLPPVLVILGVATLVIFATEFTSNTALGATMLPLLAAAAPVLGIPTEQSALSDDYWCFCCLHDAGCDTARCDYFRYRPHPDRRND